MTDTVHTTSGVPRCIHGALVPGHCTECVALFNQAQLERPCGCPADIAGAALCEERKGSPGSYCLMERQRETTERELMAYLMRHTADTLKLPAPIDGLLRRGADEIDRMREALNEILEHDPNPQAKHVARRGLGLLTDEENSNGSR